MNKTHVACLLSSLSVVALFAVSCSTPARHFPAGTGGEATSAAGDGGTGADGTMSSAGAGAMSIAGGDAGGASGAGASSGAAGMPGCGAQQKLCGDVCVDINDPTYGCDPTVCTTTGCPNSPGAVLACDAGQCVIDTCPTDYKKCGSKCVAISDPTYGCGPTTCDATACPPPGDSTLVCQNSACVIGTCGAGTKKCGSTCATTDANNGCADATRCTACANNEACSGTPSTCQCVPTPMATACANKNCGSVSNGCNGTYSCGSCSGSSPICVGNTCKQCSSVADCPTGTFNCTSNTCVCRTPSSGNIIKDGGFDTQSALSSWTSSQTVWTSSDADSCPASGSITVNGSISRCIQIPTVPAGGTQYALGMRYKAGAGGSGGCIGRFNQDANCMQFIGPDFLNLGVGESATWTTTSTVNLVYEGTSSIQIQCHNDAFLTIDQIYLKVSGASGPGF